MAKDQHRPIGKGRFTLVLMGLVLMGTVGFLFPALTFSGLTSASSYGGLFRDMRVNGVAIVGARGSSPLRRIILDNGTLNPIRFGNGRFSLSKNQGSGCGQGIFRRESLISENLLSENLPTATKGASEETEEPEAPSPLWLVVMPAIPLAGGGLIYLKRRLFNPKADPKD